MISLLLAASIALNEDYYVRNWCHPAFGQYEYRIEKEGKLVGRIDCLTPEYAIETDWSYKWAECSGQALFYSRMTGRKPACMLIIKEQKDCNHLWKIKEINKKLHQDIKLMTTGERCN